MVIGLVAPSSGFAANYGPEAEQGFELALAAAKEQAGGASIKLVKVDEDVLDSSQTLERVKKVVESDGADIVVGPIFGSNQQAVSAYLTQAGVPMFTMLGGDETLAGENSAFIWPGADTLTAGPLGTYAAEELGYDTIATLAPDYAYGKNAIQGATDAFEAAGGSVAQQQWVPLGTTDMLQYATALDKDVDALVMWLVPADAAAFVREYRNLEIKVPLLMFQGVFDPTYQEIGGDLIGEIGLNEYNHLLDNDANAEFTSAYEDEYGDVPNQTTAFAYAVANIIITALNDNDGDTSVEALRGALDGQELDTVIGAASYDVDGVAASGRTVVKSVKGDDGRFEWEPVKTYENIGH
ncbi:MAG: ABC transporter substrate-binding protein [Nocardioides sp.]|uniref:ABC transporter substrate-binding protein n=1 Tax=Nocardioides sp. TaxID=35761 RepID=UPI0032638E69